MVALDPDPTFQSGAGSGSLCSVKTNEKYNWLKLSSNFFLYSSIVSDNILLKNRIFLYPFWVGFCLRRIVVAAVDVAAAVVAGVAAALP